MRQQFVLSDVIDAICHYQGTNLSMCGYPGMATDPNYRRWDQAVAGIVNEAVRRSNKELEFDIFNEPNGHTKYQTEANLTLFGEVWRRAVLRVRSALPDAVVIGPSIASGGPGIHGWADQKSWLQKFLLLANKTHTLPTVLCWHFTSVNASDMLSQHEEMRVWMKQQSIQNVSRFAHNEAIGPSQILSPAAALSQLAACEYGGVDHLCRACWTDKVSGKSPCWDHSLDGLLTGAVDSVDGVGGAYRANGMEDVKDVNGVDYGNAVAADVTNGGGFSAPAQFEPRSNYFAYKFYADLPYPGYRLAVTRSGPPPAPHPARCQSGPGSGRDWYVKTGGNFSKADGFDDGKQDKCCRRAPTDCVWFYGDDAEADCKAALAKTTAECLGCDGSNASAIGCPTWPVPMPVPMPVPLEGRAQEEEQEEEGKEEGNYKVEHSRRSYKVEHSRRTGSSREEVRSIELMAADTTCVLDEHVDALAVVSALTTSPAAASTSAGSPLKIVVLVGRWSDGSGADTNSTTTIVTLELAGAEIKLGDCFDMQLERVRPSLRSALPPPAVEPLPKVCAKTAAELVLDGLPIKGDEVIRLTLARG
jgi:hypothetical protein